MRHLQLRVPAFQHLHDAQVDFAARRKTDVLLCKTSSAAKASDDAAQQHVSWARRAPGKLRTGLVHLLCLLLRRLL